MNKRFIITVIAVFLLTMFVSCSQEENAREHIGADSDAMLFVRFLNNEIPIIENEKWEWYEGTDDLDEVYYSDISDGIHNYSGEDIYSIFYIVDMDGDGNNEFCFYSWATLYILTYDSDNEVFNIWLEGLTKERPLGNGYIYYLGANLTAIHAFYLYDENANLLSEKIFTWEWDYHDEETGVDYKKYKIDWEVVSESEWNEQIEPWYELRDNGPESLSYQDLLDLSANEAQRRKTHGNNAH